MDEVCIYLNKYVRSTILVFTLMGITYLLIGVSDIIKHNLFEGILEISFAAIALIFLLLSVLPAFQFKLFYCIDKDKISSRVHLFQQEKICRWDSITKIEQTNTELLVYQNNNEPWRIRLNSMNYNELQYFNLILSKYIDLYRIKKS